MRSFFSARVRNRAGCVAAIFFATASCATAGDWPQYRGANHDGVSTEHITRIWSGAVTNPVWLVPVTNGLGSLSVSGGRVFTEMVRNIGDVEREICVALDIADGSELWATDMDDASYPNGGVGYDDGPRSTPSVDGDSVYVLSSRLKLYRLNVTNGAVIWQKDMQALYGGNLIQWQNAASPLVDSGLIYLNANSSTNRFFALRTSDGSIEWRSQNEGMTHSTPVIATIQGVRQLIFASQSGLVSVNPTNGVRLWKTNYPFNYSTSLAVSPVVYQDMVFVCGAHSYGMRSVVVRATLSNSVWTTTQLWNTNNPASHWMTPVAHQGFLYGMFGIQGFDSANAQLKCIDMQTGAVKWSTNGFGRSGTLLVDNHLLCITEKGDLVAVRPDTNAYTEVARFLAIPDYDQDINKCWNVPAVSDHNVYVRSTSFAARYDFTPPALKMDAPQPASANKFQLTIRAVDDSPLDFSRAVGTEVFATTNPALPVAQWSKLTNTLAATNGVLRMTNVDSTTPGQQYFIVSEPK